MALSTAIYDILRTNADVLAMFGTNIFPIVVTPGTAIPAITYSVVSYNQDSAKEITQAWDVVGIKISVIAKTYTLCETYHEYVYTALQNYAGTVSGEVIKNIDCTNKRTDDIVEMYWNSETSQGQFAFMITMDFNIYKS